MTTSLTNRKALVTGSAGGIGQAVVKVLRGAGAAVAGADIQQDDACDFFIAGDLTDSSYCDYLPIKAAEALGGLDIVVNNAGVIRRGAITEVTDEDYEVSFAVNVEVSVRWCDRKRCLLLGFATWAEPSHLLYVQGSNRLYDSVLGSRSRAPGCTYQCRMSAGGGYTNAAFWI